ncbi:MAG TPA: hypothetical protein PLD47_01080 [Aggregatilineales bacterium]|nr:hypothetical protein [Anaerolineales bacterium]HRE46292.1 hypothetical protein [Aggregatilineales bacterium]
MISEPTGIRILYTACLRGRIDLLPSLHTFLTTQRTERTILVDLGQSCAVGSWICEVTGGRGMLVAMDALGYDGFHIGRADALYHYPEMVVKMKEIVMTPFIAGTWAGSATRGGVKIGLYNAAALERVAITLDPHTDLHLLLSLDRTAEMTANLLQGERLVSLACLPTAPTTAPLIGQLDLELLPNPPGIRVVNQRPLAIPPETPPHPTISGVVEFVLSEARQAEQKRGGA